MRNALLTSIILALAALGCRRESKAPASHDSSQPKATTAKPAPQGETPATSTETAVGTPMPAYTAELIDGKTFDVQKERGNVVFLNLWATWCVPCRAEIPELEKMHAQHAAEGFKVVGVSLDEGGKDGVQQFVTEEKMNYPVALDPEGKLANLFQTSVIPTSVLINREGKIVWRKYGAILGQDPQLERALADALAQKRS
jgi:peroxiredoxin